MLPLQYFLTTIFHSKLAFFINDLSEDLEVGHQLNTPFSNYSHNGRIFYFKFSFLDVKFSKWLNIL